MTATPRARIVHLQWAESRFEMATRAPAAPLRSLVRGDYQGYVERTPAPLLRRELPGLSVVVILEFGPALRVSAPGVTTAGERHGGGFVAGLCDTFTLTAHDGFQQGVQVNLTPIGARALFGLPMSELAGRAVSLRDLFPREHRSLSERLAALPTWDARLDLVDALFLRRLADARGRFDVAAWGLRRIESTAGALDLRDLARELGYRPKHVVALFRDAVGVPPRTCARLARFDGLTTRLRSGAALPWSELALRCGYYDQAHLAREVRRLTGDTPTALRASLVGLGAGTTSG